MGLINIIYGKKMGNKNYWKLRNKRDGEAIKQQNIERLRNLNRMFANGTITKEEYDKKIKERK